MVHIGPGEEGIADHSPALEVVVRNWLLRWPPSVADVVVDSSVVVDVVVDPSVADVVVDAEVRHKETLLDYKSLHHLDPSGCDQVTCHGHPSFDAAVADVLVAAEPFAVAEPSAVASFAAEPSVAAPSVADMPYQPAAVV